jgi:hypothetical protein
MKLKKKLLKVLKAKQMVIKKINAKFDRNTN